MAVALTIGRHARGAPEDGERGGLAAAFLVALSLHAGALALVAFWRANPPQPPGEQEITVDLAPQMVEAPSDAAVETSQPAGQPAEAVPLQPSVESVVAQPTPPEVTAEMASVEAVPPPQQEIAAAVEPPTPQPVAPPIQSESVLPPDARPIESTAVEAVPLPLEPVQARPVPQPRPEPKPRPVPKPVERKVLPERKPPPERVREAVARPQPVRRPPPPVGAAGTTQREAERGQSSRENAGGSAASAADPAAMSRWTSQIAAALRGRLRYPDAARSSGASGVATLRFTLHRSGRVVSASLARSAGHPLLDQAALATAGGTLPAAPDGVAKQQITISVPLRFDMR